MFVYNTVLERVTVKNTSITEFNAPLVHDLTTFWTESDNQVVFDIDTFVENTFSSDSSKFVELSLGGKSLKEVRSKSEFSKNNPSSIQIVEVSDYGVFDVTKILSKFSNGVKFSMIGKRDDEKVRKLPLLGSCYQETGNYHYPVNKRLNNLHDCDQLDLSSYSMATLEFSFGFYDTFKVLKISGFYDISNLLVIEPKNMPVNLVELELRSNRLSNVYYITEEKSVDIKVFLKNFNNLEIINLDYNSFEIVPFDKNSNPDLIQASLRNNKLKHLKAHELPRKLKKLDVSGNTFECTCEDVAHQNFIIDNWENYNVDMKLSLNYECSNFENDVNENILIKDLDLSYCGRFDVPDDDEATTQSDEITKTDQSDDDFETTANSSAGILISYSLLHAIFIFIR